jgi:hypothetical protein
MTLPLLGRWKCLLPRGRECRDGAWDVVSRAPRMVLRLCQGIRPYSLSSSLISVSLIRSIS